MIFTDKTYCEIHLHNVGTTFKPWDYTISYSWKTEILRELELVQNPVIFSYQVINL